MPSNAIGPTGITTQTIQEIIDEILNGTPDYPGMFQIYGADINVGSNSPDGQMVNIIAQAKLDVLQFIQMVYQSFDPDQAIGTALNQRCAINGVTRQPGTYTQQGVFVTVDRALTLQGKDLYPDNPFTVSDQNGNEYQLVNTFNTPGAGTTGLTFYASKLGPVSSLANTVTVIKTIQLGVISVNNPNGPDEVGVTEESDFSLRIRRQKSVSLPSQGYLEGLVAGLTDVSGVNQCVVLENNTNATDANGIPGHSIWVIVDGGTNADVALVIYDKRNAGCGMKGSVSVAILQIDESYFTVYFDRPTHQNLWISFNVTALGSGSVDANFIRTQLLAQLDYGINQAADTTSIVTLIRSIAPSASVSSEGVSSDGVLYYPVVNPTAVNYQFVPASTRIIINGTPGT